MLPIFSKVCIIIIMQWIIIILFSTKLITLYSKVLPIKVITLLGEDALRLVKLIIMNLLVDTEHPYLKIIKPVGLVSSTKLVQIVV